MHFITFSRKMGTNGTEIARQVAMKLEYKFYETEAIENEARRMGLLESVREIDEKSPPLFQRLFSHRPTIDLDRLHCHFEDRLCCAAGEAPPQLVQQASKQVPSSGRQVALQSS